MSCWLTIPSARPPAEAEKCLAKWRAQGYKIALFRDAPPEDPAWQPDPAWEPFDASDGFTIKGHYQGYARTVNALIKCVMAIDSEADWLVTGGDDTEPDPNHTAEEIARQCGSHFRTELIMRLSGNPGACDLGTAELESASTFGVMQCTGDRFAQGSIDKIAGSPWIGKEFARRMYGGNGPLWPEYTRFFMDNELQDVAIQYGVFQQRRDLIHLHRHYMRRSDDLNAAAFVTEVPRHLAHQESKWDEEKKIYLARKNARPTPFPGSEPIA